ncbi:MAG: hypothetical protein R3F34_17375 [Planctomycetota bacterium]
MSKNELAIASVTCFLLVGVAALLLVERSENEPEDGSFAHSTARSDASTSVSDGGERGGDGERTPVGTTSIEDGSDEEHVERPELFRGRWTAEDFLERWWGEKWPEVAAFIDSNEDVVLSEGEWDMDTIMLPEEAERWAEERLLTVALGRDPEKKRADQLRQRTRLPMDASSGRLGSADSVFVGRRRGEDVELSAADGARFKEAVAPLRERMAATWEPYYDELLRSSTERIRAGAFDLHPFVEFLSEDKFHQDSKSQIYFANTNVWQARIKFDLAEDPHLLMLFEEYEKTQKACIDEYWAIASAYL